jgi:tyrosyl-tRNA synthetase
MSTLSEDLQWRNLIKDHTFQDIAWLNEPKKFYLGADVGSADSLTIGNLAVFMLARRLMDAGWQAVLLVGGATSLIGDPGGKDTERELVSREQVEHNKASIRAQVEKLFAGREFTLVDNYDWFKEIGYLEFLRDVGKHFSLTELLQRDFIADRIGEAGSGISYAEFSYSLIQGYDFWHLFKQHGVLMQIGGSDQWGNMLSGVPLIRKKEQAEAHAFSMPLVINRATGRKFGKSEDGAVWLDAAKTSPYKFYQFWLNADDAGVEDYLKVYTLLDRTTIEGVMAEFQSNPAGRVAQKRLAYEVTALLHGKEQADAQVKLAETVFGSVEIHDLSSEELEILKQEMPYVQVTRDALSMVHLATVSGLASSNSEARRLLEGGAMYVNNQQYKELELHPESFKSNVVLLRRGKSFKDSALIELQ